MCNCSHIDSNIDTAQQGQIMTHLPCNSVGQDLLWVFHLQPASMCAKGLWVCVKKFVCQSHITSFKIEENDGVMCFFTKKTYQEFLPSRKQCPMLTNAVWSSEQWFSLIHGLWIGSWGLRVWTKDFVSFGLWSLHAHPPAWKLDALSQEGFKRSVCLAYRFCQLRFGFAWICEAIESNMPLVKLERVSGAMFPIEVVERVLI